MKNVAALIAASLLMLLVACAPDRPVSSQAAETTVPSGEVATVRSFPSHAGAPGSEVRDAREAAEDAARKIYDATLNAASRIREAGVDAVQAVRPGGAEEAEVAPTEEVANANPASASESEPARN